MLSSEGLQCTPSLLLTLCGHILLLYAAIQAGYAPVGSSGAIVTAIASLSGITGTTVCPKDYYCQVQYVFAPEGLPLAAESGLPLLAG
jgi:hypothetical protein